MGVHHPHPTVNLSMFGMIFVSPDGKIATTKTSYIPSNVVSISIMFVLSFIEMRVSPLAPKAGGYESEF